jgi:hypothetical protein
MGHPDRSEEAGVVIEPRRIYATLGAIAALVASCATAPPQPSPAPRAGSTAAERISSDELLANAIYAKLNANPTYYFRHVDVRLENGVAHLSGYVWSTDALYAARNIARSVPGVTRVVTSQLELERNGRNSGVTR